MTDDGRTHFLGGGCASQVRCSGSAEEYRFDGAHDGVVGIAVSRGAAT